MNRKWSNKSAYGHIMTLDKNYVIKYYLILVISNSIEYLVADLDVAVCYFFADVTSL